MRLVTTTADLADYYRDKSTAAPLAGIKSTGFKNVDFSMYSVIYKDSPWIGNNDLWKKEIEKSIQIAEKDGLVFCQAHSPDGVHFREGEDRDALIKAIKNSIEACSMLGIPHTVIHAQGIKGCSRDEFFKKNIDFFKIFEELSEKFSVDLLVENSASAWNPEYYLQTGNDMVEFIQKSGMRRLYICWDVGHANVQGCNQYDDIIIMGDKLHAFHIQDNFGDYDSHMMPMCGTTNFDNVIRGIIDSGYRGDFTFEGCNTIRRSKSWPNYRRFYKESDILTAVPLSIQQKQISVMYEIGKWMLESYDIQVQ